MLWSQGSKLSEVAMTFGIAVLAVRGLQASAFGTYSLLTNLAGAASVFVPIVTMEALGAVVPRIAAVRQRAFLLVLVAGLRGLVIVTASVVLVAAWPVLSPAIGLGFVPRKLAIATAVYWVAQDTMNTIVAYYGATIEMRPVAIWRAVGLGSSLAAVVVLALTDTISVGAVIASTMVGSAVSAAGLAFRLRRAGRPAAPDRAVIRQALALTRHVWVIGLLGFVLATQIDILLIGGLTHDPRQVGFYAVAVGVVGRAQILLVSGWSSLIIPAFGHTLVEAGADALRRAWRAASQLWVLISVSISALLLANAPAVVHVLFGPTYGASVPLLRWMSLFNLVAAFQMNPPVVGAIWVYDRQKALARIRIFTAAVNLALAVPLILRWGAIGAVVATGIAALVGGALEFALARRIGATSYPRWFAVVAAVAGGAAMLPAVVLEPITAVRLAVSLVAGLILFTVVIAIARPFSSADERAAASVHPRLASLMRSFARR